MDVGPRGRNREREASCEAEKGLTSLFALPSELVVGRTRHGVEVFELYVVLVL